MSIILKSFAGFDQRLRVMVALLLVYVVWGTTYFAIGIALRDMPPLWLNASRFVAAGLLMMAWALWRGERLPAGRQWAHAAIVGALMVFAAMNLVVLAQRAGIGSGLMATVVTTMPMWLALWTRLGGERVPATSWAGLALGVAGALLLAREGDFAATVAGGLMAFGAPLAWSLGSFASRRLEQPAPAMAAGVQWLAGGLLGAVAAGAIESPAPMGQAGVTAWLAWAYLLVMGTLVALNAYLWLLQHTAPALAGSYSFVNPAVALLVGTLLGGEHLTGWVWAALPLIFGALALILYGGALASMAVSWGSALTRPWTRSARPHGMASPDGKARVVHTPAPTPGGAGARQSAA